MIGLEEDTMSTNHREQHISVPAMHQVCFIPPMMSACLKLSHQELRSVTSNLLILPFCHKLQANRKVIIATVLAHTERRAAVNPV